LASSINIPAYSDALVVLGTAGVVVPLVHRWGINPVLGYLVAGAVLGPFGLGSFINEVPAFYWLTVVDAKNVAGIADLGVVFLLFLIGLELSYERLYSMRRLVVGLGGLQVVISMLLIAGIVGAAGIRGPIALMLGACLALSSTAIVLEVLAAKGRLPTSAGRASFAVLLAQDIAVIPILIFVSVLGTDSAGQSILTTIGIALGQIVSAVALIAVVGRLLLRPLFRLVARTQSTELFMATIFFVIVATGLVSAFAGLSMALGAFVAGLLLAETEYRKAVIATIEPFKGLLLGIFFFTVGMGMDVRVLLRDPWLLVGCLVGLLVLKAAILLTLARLYRLSWSAGIEMALLLAPAGEFAFVGIGLAVSHDILSQETAGLAMAVASLSMAMIPMLALVAQRLTQSLTARRPLDPVLLAPPEPRMSHAVVVGYGRVGSLVCDMLDKHGIPYTGVDNNPATVTAFRKAGRQVYFGDATNPAFLKTCGVMEANAVIVTIHTQTQIDSIVGEVRKLRPDVLIVSRARDADHARHLYAIGVTDAVPETIEASLQLSEAALVGLGVPTGPVIASIHEKRDEFRHDLQEAARNVGLEETRAFRPKTTA